MNLLTELSDQQRDVLSEIQSFVKGGSNVARYMTIMGLAGTGKTTCAAHFARSRPSVILAAPTGKAAAVLRAKTGLDVRTIHQVIYDFKGLVEDEDDPERKRRRPTFEPKGVHLGGEIVVCDEVSMIGTAMARDLLATRARIIAFGDPGQLPPVKDRSFFIDPDVELTEIHRQALESAVIRQAHAIRAGHGYEDDGPDFRVVGGWSDEILRTHDIALCWRNNTRRRLNVYRRKAFGFNGSTLFAGEPVMCLRNDHTERLYNGQVYTLAKDRRPGEDLILDRGDGGRACVLNAVIEGIDPKFDAYEEDDSPYAVAYAATVHKAQGDQWKRVLWVDEMNGECGDYRKWAYTAVTRAEKSVTVVKL